MCVGAGLELNSAGLLPPCSTLAKKGLFAISNVHQNASLPYWAMTSQAVFEHEGILPETNFRQASKAENDLQKNRALLI